MGERAGIWPVFVVVHRVFFYIRGLRCCVCVCASSFLFFRGAASFCFFLVVGVSRRIVNGGASEGQACVCRCEQGFFCFH